MVIKKIFVLGIVGIVFFALNITGCRISRPVIIAPTEPLVRSQEVARRIEAINGSIADALRSFDSNIGELNERAIRGNLSAEEALGRYDEFVIELLGNYRRTQQELNTLRREIEGAQYNPVLGGNPFLD